MRSTRLLGLSTVFAVGLVVVAHGQAPDTGTRYFPPAGLWEKRDRGLIKDVRDSVAPYIPPGVDLFSAEHDARITWEYLLRQTSD